MIQFYQDKFDTEIFDCKVFKLFIEKDLQEELEIKDLLAKNGISTIFCFSKFSNKNIIILEKLKFNLISIKTTYKLTNFHRIDKRALGKGFKLLQNSKKNHKVDETNIIEIAQTIGSTSRYFKDNKIPSKKSLDLYVKWVKNSLFNNYSDEAFVLFDNDFLVGIITLKIKEKNGYIDLIGLLPEYQNYGLGRILLYKGIMYLRKNKVENIFVITEGENIQANKFYQKNGFMIDKIELVYHKHLKRIDN